MTPRILMVDDEQRILDGIRRSLHGRYAITTANSGAEGLELQRAELEKGTPFPVIVSDMMMPGMNGAQFLTAARHADPDVVSLILSGQADINSTIAAVNEAAIFSFLTKPCDKDSLVRALDRALTQHQLVISEREILHQTLHGSVDLLTGLMSGVSPRAFHRTLRIRELLAAAEAAGALEFDWEIHLAAKLSQIGCLTIPADVVDRAYGGVPLAFEEQSLFEGHPITAQALLERIPRLERIATWVGQLPVWPSQPPPDDAEMPFLLLCAIAAYVGSYEMNGNGPSSLTPLHSHGRYPREVLETISRTRHTLTPPDGVPKDLRLPQVRPGMSLREDLLTTTGMVLVRSGEEITESLVVRIRNFADSVGIQEPIRVIDHWSRR